MKKRPIYKKRRFIILISAVLALLLFRIYLPHMVKSYANSVLADLPGYYGSVSDIDIALYRGAYVIKGLNIQKIEAKTKVPFINIPKIDISIEWQSLFKGKIVSELYVYNPDLIYVHEDMESADQTEEKDWVETLVNLVPVAINHFEILDGKIAYVEVNAEPNIDLQFTNLNFTADNLRNVVAKPQTLPSPIYAEATSTGDGKLIIEGDVNLIKKIPDVDLALSLENFDITAANDFAEHYAGVDFEKGKVSVFVETAIADANLKGYLKVLLNDTKFIGSEESLLQIKKESLLAIFKYLFENKKTDNIAVKAPLEGNLADVETEVFSTIVSIFKNAFVEAFKTQTDNEIEYEDAFQEGKNKEENKDKKWWQIWKKGT